MNSKILLLFLIFGCPSSEDKGSDEAGERLSSYLSARCRFLTDPACVTSQERSCENIVTYDSLEDCKVQEADRYKGCTEEIEGALTASSETLSSCVATLTSFSCADAEVCEGDAPIYGTGDCSTVVQILNEVCP